MGNSVSQAFTDFGNSVKDVAVSAWNGVTEVAQNVGEGAVGFVTNLVNGNPGEAFKAVGDAVVDSANTVGQTAADIGKTVVEGASDVVSNVAKIGGEAVDLVTDGVQAVADAVGAGDAVRSTLEAVDQGAQFAGNNIGHAADAVASVATTVIEGNQEIMASAAEGVKQVAGEVVQGDFSGAAEAFGNAVVDTANSAADAIQSNNGAILDAGKEYIEDVFTEHMQVGTAVAEAVGDVARQTGLDDVAELADMGKQAAQHLADNPEIASSIVQDLAAGTPLVGQALGASQAMAGRLDEAADTLKTANASTMAAIGGMVAGPAGAAAGLAAGELINTGINAAANGGEWQPTGFIESFNNAATGEGDMGVNITRGLLDVIAPVAGGVSGAGTAAKVAEVVDKAATGASTVIGNLDEHFREGAGAAAAVADTQPVSDQNADGTASLAVSEVGPEVVPLTALPGHEDGDVDLTGISFPGQADPAPQPPGDSSTWGAAAAGQPDVAAGFAGFADSSRGPDSLLAVDADAAGAISFEFPQVDGMVAAGGMPDAQAFGWA